MSQRANDTTSITAHNANSLIEEWKARYGSYRDYRSQYLTVLSIFVAAWVLGLGIVAQNGTPHYGKVLIATALVIGLSALFAGHVIALRAIVTLGERLHCLETQLKFEDFSTTRPLELGIKTGMYLVPFCLALTIVALVLAAVGVL